MAAAMLASRVGRRPQIGFRTGLGFGAWKCRLAIEIQRPTYSKAFQCIGPACEDTCCQAWGLTVDQSTWQRYQLIPAESLLRPVIDRRVVLLPEPRTEARYAQILLNEDLTCPFLTRERWCGIQMERGAEYLSKTCASYPRAISLVAGEEEESLQLSCPEAARLVLLDRQALGLRLGGTEERYQRLLIALKDSSALGETDGMAGGWPFFAEIRAFTLLLVTDRAYPLWQRLFLLGLFCRRLDGLVVEGESDRIPGLLGDYAQIASSGALRGQMDGIAAQPDRQLAVILHFLEMRLGRTLNSMRFLDCGKEFLDGIGYRPGTTPESLAPAYSEAYERYYEPLMRAHPQLMENYLINHVFKAVFPFGKERASGRSGVLHGYLVLCAHHALTKGLLIGMAGFYRERFAPEHVVRLVQAYGRMIEHHGTFPAETVAYLEGQAMAEPAGMAMLLRN